MLLLMLFRVMEFQTLGVTTRGCGQVYTCKVIAHRCLCFFFFFFKLLTGYWYEYDHTMAAVYDSMFEDLIFRL